MTFVAPSRIPPVSFSPYASLQKHTVGTLCYDQAYNYDLITTKVELRSLLKQHDLSVVRAGFPFHCVQDSSGVSSMSYASYEFYFREYFHGMEKRTIPKSATFRYTSPSSRSGMMEWTVVVPERQSTYDPRHSPGMFWFGSIKTVIDRPLPFAGTVSIAHVQVAPVVMETPFAVTFMTNPRIVQEALALSLELGTLITVQTARKTMSPYGSGEILFLSTDSRGRSRLVCTFQLWLL